MKSRFSKFFQFFQTSTNSHRIEKKKKRHADRWLMVTVAILTLFGLLLVYDSSVAIALRDFGDQYHFFREQAQWLAIGIIAMIVFSKIDYHLWYKSAFPLMLLVLALLIVVLIPGLGIKALGARRWLDFGFFILQPAEVAKLALIIYLSAWFSYPEKGRLGAFLLLIGFVVGLVVLEPDIGTGVIILSISLILYFLSGAPVANFLLLIPAILGLLLVLALGSPYRLRRLMTFLNPESDPLGASYQIRQALIALGSGGLFGVGLGKSRQKYEYLPEANTDSIFAIIGEEVGFIGAILVIMLFLFLVIRGFRISRQAPDTLGSLLAVGIASWIGVQSIINISAMVALIPLTGVPLPFISYGGSSLVILLSAVGILLSISRYRV